MTYLLKTILIREFNARHPDWNNTSENYNGIRLKRLIEHTQHLLYSPVEPIRYSFDDNRTMTLKYEQEKR